MRARGIVTSLTGLALVTSAALAQGLHDSPATDATAGDAAMEAASAAAPTGAMTTLDGVFTQAQADRGQLVFDEHCVSCHGANLRGTWNMGPSILGSRFERRWAGLTVADLYYYLKVSMPKSDPGSLTDAEYAEVVAYYLLRNDFPPGTAFDIPLDEAAQELITIVSE